MQTKNMNIFASLACSVDGRITPPNLFHHVNMTSDDDITRLKKLRDRAGAIVFGGGSLRAYSGLRVGHNRDQVPHQFIITRKGIPKNAKILKHKDKIAIFSDQKLVHDLVESDIKTLCYGEDRDKELVELIISYAMKIGVTDLMIEGGGRILNLFLKTKELNSLYLTLSPHIFGNIQTPALVQGSGYDLEDCPKLVLDRMNSSNNEVYLDYSIKY